MATTGPTARSPQSTIGPQWCCAQTTRSKQLRFTTPLRRLCFSTLRGTRSSCSSSCPPRRWPNTVIDSKVVHQHRTASFTAAQVCQAMSGPVVWVPLTLCASIGLALERVPWISRWTSSIFVSMACAAALSYCGLLPHACAAYELIWSTLMPIGTALLLLRSPSLFVPVASRIFSEDSEAGATEHFTNHGKTTNRMQSSTLAEVPSSSSTSNTGLNSSSNPNEFQLISKSKSTAEVAVATVESSAQHSMHQRTQHSMHVTHRTQQQSSSENKSLPQQHFIAFAAATAATIVGTIVAWVVVARSAVATGAVDASCMASLAAALCASYIGGSVNFAAILQALDVRNAPLIASTLAVDNIATVLFLSAMFFIPASRKYAPMVPGAPDPLPEASDYDGSHANNAQVSRAADLKEQVHKLANKLAATVAAVFMAWLCCVAGGIASRIIGVPGFQLALVAVVADAVGSCIPQVLARTSNNPRRARSIRKFELDAKAGASMLSSLFMVLFFSTIGAAAGQASLAGALPFVFFVSIQLSVHGAITAAASAFLKIPAEVAMVASNAAVGGPATAAAMAAARGWTTLIPSAVMLGGLGYGIGTWLGLWVHRILMAL